MHGRADELQDMRRLHRKTTACRARVPHHAAWLAGDGREMRLRRLVPGQRLRCLLLQLREEMRLVLLLLLQLRRDVLAWKAASAAQATVRLKLLLLLLLPHRPLLVMWIGVRLPPCTMNGA